MRSLVDIAACALLILAASASSGQTESPALPNPAVQPESSASATHPPAFEKMGAHMSITPLRPERPGDRERAQAIVLAARAALEPYKDWHKAVEAGYVIQIPELEQVHYHFVNSRIGVIARTLFDPAYPPALIYEKIPVPAGAEPQYKLVGAMYQTGVDVTEQDLDNRVPLSIAQWHTHDDICVPPPTSKVNWLGPDKTFGFSGSIDKDENCVSVGGTFMTHVGGWMTHVYPFETDPAMQWRTDMDHDGMEDHPAAMPGMDMSHGSMPGMDMPVAPAPKN